MKQVFRGLVHLTYDKDISQVKFLAFDWRYILVHKNERELVQIKNKGYLPQL